MLLRLNVSAICVFCRLSALFKLLGSAPLMEDEELKKLLEQASHSRSDPRFTDIRLEVEEDASEAGAIRRAVKKRQCANCTCSRSTPALPADSAIAESKRAVVPKGGCGSCSLGDAFRCDSCPYRGMPAFKEGEEFRFEDGLNDL